MATPWPRMTMSRTARLNAPLAFALVATFGCAPTAMAQVPNVDSIRKLLTHATYVFEGVVTKWGAVADSALRASPQTGIVRTTATLACPHEVGDFTGEDVTVLGSATTHVPVGAPTWFFGTGWAVGANVAVTLVSAVPAPAAQQSDSLSARFGRAVFLGKRAAVQAAAGVASEITLATVTRATLAHAPRPSAESEHQARWAILGVRFDSSWGVVRRDTARGGAPVNVGGWRAPPASPRQTDILVPAAVAFTSTGTPVLATGNQRIFLLELISRRPNLQTLDGNATAFAPTLGSVLLPADANLLGGATPNPVFGLAPVHMCERPIP